MGAAATLTPQQPAGSRTLRTTSSPARDDGVTVPMGFCSAAGRVRGGRSFTARRRPPGRPKCMLGTSLGAAPQPDLKPARGVAVVLTVRLAWSGDLPAPVADVRDYVDASAERRHIGAQHVDSGDLAMLDLGDAGLRHAECLSELRLG